MSSTSPTNQQPSNLIFLPPPPPSPYIFHLNSTNIPLLPTTNPLNNSIKEHLNLNLLNSLLIKHFQQQQNNFKNSFKLPNNGQQINNNEFNNNNSLFTNNNTKVEDPIQNFHSPNNIILLPVGCHSLPDEKHIQLLGAPQTILPIAVHSNILNNFPINPIILESKISSKILFKNCCNQKQNLLCHLPIAINKIIKQQLNTPKKEQKINNFVDVSCQTEDNNNYLITSSSPSTSSTFNINNSSNSGIEPLDLSISNNNKQQKQYLRKRASTTTTILLQQPSKDLNKKEEITSKKSKKELIILIIIKNHQILPLFHHFRHPILPKLTQIIIKM
uniref:Uncharacterized protein n=1 Tax=Meloidogyne enterolobii TaxID=390850 RepID=A0A6V7WD76_MELEN|nr:unnamed protein product [Meloidogyne enterolobii]